MNQKSHIISPCTAQWEKYYWLGGIFLLGFLLRFFVWYWNPIIVRDSYWYIQIAEHLHNGGSFETIPPEFGLSKTPPLYCFIIKSLMFFGVSAETAGVALNLLLGSLAPLVTYGIAWEVTQKKKIARSAALLIAVHPDMVKMSTKILRDIPYLFCIGLALYFLVAGIRQQRWWYWAGSGIIFSFAMLLRYESLEMIPIFLLVLSIMTALKDLSWRQAIKGAGISGICAVLSFFCLIYAMQCEKYISENYSLYFSGKTQMLEKQFSGAE